MNNPLFRREKNDIEQEKKETIQRSKNKNVQSDNWPYNLYLLLCFFNWNDEIFKYLGNSFKVYTGRFVPGEYIAF